MQTVPIGKITGAYAEAMQMGADGPGAALFLDKAAAAATGETFTEFMRTQASDAVASVEKAETVSEAALRGKASAQEVVEAVMAAEMTVQTVVSVRDRVIGAYQEIMRMPI